MLFSTNIIFLCETDYLVSAVGAHGPVFNRSCSAAYAPMGFQVFMG